VLLPCDTGNPEDSAVVHHCTHNIYPKPCPQQPQAEHTYYNIKGVIQRHKMSRESKRLKKSSSWLNADNALIQHLIEKCNFCVSRFAK